MRQATVMQEAFFGKPRRIHEQTGPTCRTWCGVAFPLSTEEARQNLLLHRISLDDYREITRWCALTRIES
jgi:hypothetical protein